MNIQSEIEFFSDLGLVDKARFIVRLMIEVAEEAKVGAGDGHDLSRMRFANEINQRLARFSYQLLSEDAARPQDDVAIPDRSIELSFSQLHDFEVCPVRYRFGQVWGVPAPPDEMLPAFVRASGSSELGASVHAALAAWHTSGGDLLGIYRGPDAGREMLERYLAHPLAAATTLGVELEFNLRLGRARVRGFVDRVCEVDGRTVLVDYKTNATLDERLIEAYSMQLRIYGLAARRGLLPGGADPRLVLFDIRRGRLIEVTPDDAAVEARIAAATAKILAGDFALGPEHAERPCTLCAFKPICADARVPIHAPVP
jgi:RecB family exonuclease